MVLLSLGSGLITALMANATPARISIDMDWMVENAAAEERDDSDHAVSPLEKKAFSQ